MVHFHRPSHRYITWSDCSVRVSTDGMNGTCFATEGHSISGVPLEVVIVEKLQVT